MKEITELYLDMDGTLIDFAQGDIDRAIALMAMPEYYKGLKPKEDVIDILTAIKGRGVKLNIISGIPDLIMLNETRNSRRLTNYFPADFYRTYYDIVSKYKQDTIDKYYGPDFFDNIYFVASSDNKAARVAYFRNLCSLKGFVLIDDMKRYCQEWSKLGGEAYCVKENASIKQVLENIYNDLVNGSSQKEQAIEVINEYFQRLLSKNDPYAIPLLCSLREDLIRTVKAKVK